MGDEPDRRKMLERLFAFMDERGTPIVAVPTISKLAVDLFRLYHIVKDFGGMVEVCVILSILCHTSCYYYYNHFTDLLDFVRDCPGEPVPER